MHGCALLQTTTQSLDPSVPNPIMAYAEIREYTENCQDGCKVRDSFISYVVAADVKHAQRAVTCRACKRVRQKAASFGPNFVVGKSQHS